MITVVYIRNVASLGHVNMSHDLSHTQTRKTIEIQITKQMKLQIKI